MDQQNDLLWRFPKLLIPGEKILAEDQNTMLLKIAALESDVALLQMQVEVIGRQLQKMIMEKKVGGGVNE